MKKNIKRVTRLISSLWPKFRNFYYLQFRSIFSSELTLNLSSTVSVIQPTYLSGTGCIEIGHGVTFGFKFGGYFRSNCIELIVRNGGMIRVGAGTHFNNNVFISSHKHVEIGVDCLIGHNCEFSDADGHEIDPERRKCSPGITEPTVIGDNVWLGNNCKILRGACVGDNSIVAAGAVVKGKFGANCIIGGIPAKTIREIES